MKTCDGGYTIQINNEHRVKLTYVPLYLSDFMQCYRRPFKIQLSEHPDQASLEHGLNPFEVDGRKYELKS